MKQKVISRLGDNDIMVDAQALQVLMHRYVPLQAALTSGSFFGDSFSTTAKTLIDLSVAFGVPDGVRAIDVAVRVRDSGSAAGSAWLCLGPTNTAALGKYFGCGGIRNDAIAYLNGIVQCDADGDIYYQTLATGASTLDVWIYIWGYFI